MPLDVLIRDLKIAVEPSRKLDVEIALEAGYRRQVEPIDGESPSNGRTSRVVWLSPATEHISKIPSYTQSIDHALKLAQKIAPGHVGGVRWEDGKAIAKIDDGPYCRAATPAMAICLAALVMKAALQE